MTIVSFSGVPWFTAPEGVPTWFDSAWPLSGHREQLFHALDPRSKDELLIRAPSIKVDVHTAKFAARFTGFTYHSSTWGAFCRQQVLVDIKGEWLLLFAPASEKAIRKGMPKIDEVLDLDNSDCSLYLKLKGENTKDYIETIRLALPQNGIQDLDEIRNIAELYSKLTPELRNLCELLIIWGVTNSQLWPELLNDFKDFEVLVPYLVDRRVLYPDGMHPLHCPADTPLIVLAKKWLELRSDQGGPANDKQRNFVAAIAKDILGVRPADLSSVMLGWHSNVQTCAKSAADRLNIRLEKYHQEWRVDAASSGRCRIVEASGLKAKNSRRKVENQANSTNKTSAGKV